MKAAGLATGAVAFSGCASGPNAFRLESEAQLAEDSVSASEAWYATACAECSAGCGVLVRVVEGRARKIEGNPDHPVNLGKLCARGQAALQTEYNPDRIRGPLARGGARGVPPQTGLTWDQALQTLADRLKAAQGQQMVLITPPLGGHEASIVQSFAAGYGVQWLRLDVMNEEPLRNAVQRLYGQPLLPEFDIAHAGYVLSFGADVLGGWISPVHYGVEYGAFRQGSYRAGDFRPQDRPRGYWVQVEPRFSATAAAADEWLPIKPGREGLLALSLAQALSAAVAGTDTGAAQWYASLDAYTPEAVAGDIGLPASRIHKVADDFAKRGPSLVIGGGSAGAHTNGSEAVAGILALNLFAQQAGKSNGLVPNTISPLPGLPGRATPNPLNDWNKLVDDLGAGKVAAVLVYDANPVFELPATLGFAEALRQAPFIASFSSFQDETTALADLVLPAHLPLEDWGESFAEPAPGSAVVTIRQPILSPLYDTRGFYDVILSLDQALRPGPAAPSMQPFVQDTARKLQQLAGGTDFQRFWLDLRQKGFGQWMSGANRPTAVRVTPVSWQDPQFAGDAAQYPYYLQPFVHNSLGAGRAANLPWMQALPDPVTSVVWETWVEVSPKLGFKEGDVVRVETPQGSAELPVYVSPAAPPDVISIPLGQGHNAYGRYAKGRGANVLDLLAPLAESATGSLAYAATRARLVSTGRRMALSKFEGDVLAYQIPGKEVLEVKYGAK